MERECCLPMAEVETSTRGRCSAGSAFTASTTRRVAATLERLISALCAAVHRVAIGSPVDNEINLLPFYRLQELWPPWSA